MAKRGRERAKAFKEARKAKEDNVVRSEKYLSLLEAIRRAKNTSQSRCQ